MFVIASIEGDIDSEEKERRVESLGKQESVLTYSCRNMSRSNDQKHMFLICILFHISTYHPQHHSILRRFPLVVYEVGQQ